MLCGEAPGAHVVQDDVGAVPVGRLLQLGGDVVVVVDHDVGAQLAARSSRSAAPAVAATRAPSAFATWIACVPMPPVPPCTRNVSPARSRPSSRRSTTPCTPPRGSRPPCPGRPVGHGQHLRAGTTTFSAYPPPASSAHTSSPTDQPVTPSPSARPPRALQTDDLRRPGRRRVVALALHQVGAVHRGGRDVDQHLARPATGSGTSDHSRISGPPGSPTVIACMPAEGIRSPRRALGRGRRRHRGNRGRTPVVTLVPTRVPVCERGGVSPG